MQLIKLLIADDMDELRSNVRRMLRNEESIQIIGEAVTGEETIAKAKEFQPHIVLMDINMPDLDGLKATEVLAKDCPHIQTIMMSIQGEQEYFRRAMKAGAKDFLVKPFSSSDLVDTIKNVYSQWLKDRPDIPANLTTANVLTFFSAKGGVGKTMLTSNIASAFADRNKRTLLIDASLQFGDIAITLNIPSKRTIADLVNSVAIPEDITYNAIERYIMTTPVGLDVLIAPREPAMADAVKPEHIKYIIEAAKPVYQYIVIDTPAFISEKELSIFDVTDVLFLVLTLDITSVKSAKLTLKTLKDISFDMNKVKIILNKEVPSVGISKGDLESGLGTPVYSVIPMDSETAQTYLNKGEPFVLKEPGTHLARAIIDTAEHIIGPKPKPETAKSAILKIKDILFGTFN
ncbi:MAG: MinD/ParA family protein [Candidatus Riflebacteria bacterium]|nr:MinD/ParA family protein [Candidatus Riflebacteria bacterium]